MKLTSVQSYAIVICALLFTTFGHEFLHAHRHQYESKKHNPLILHKRDNSDGLQKNEECDAVCFSGGSSIYGHLTLHIDVKSNLIFVYNNKTSVAWGFDYEAKIHALFNGNSGGTIIVNINEKIVYDKQTDIWYANQTSFENFFNNITSLKEIWERAKVNGIYFQEGILFPKYLTKETQERIAEIFGSLSEDISSNIRKSREFAKEILFKYAQTWIKIWGSSLQEFFKYYGKVNLKLSGDLIWLFNVFSGLLKILETIEGGVATLQKYSIKFRLDLLFSAYYGLQAFIVILEDIAAHANIAEILMKKCFQNIAVFLEIIVLLGGKVSVGLNGVFNVIYNIAVVYNNNLSLTSLVEALVILQYSEHREWSIGYIRNSVQTCLKILYQQREKYQNSKELEVIVNFFQSFTDPKVVTFGGIAMYRLYQILDTFRSSWDLSVLIRVLVIIRKSIKIGQTIPVLIFVILKHLNTKIGLRIVSNLRLEIDWVRTSSGQIDIIATIKRDLKVSDYTKYLNNLPQLIRHLPIIKQISDGIDAILKKETNGEYSLDEILQCKGAIKALKEIKTWLTSELNIKIIGSGILENVLGRHHPHKEIAHVKSGRFHGSHQ